MTKAPVIQGWCPGALRPMMSGDGLVVRVRAPLGRLTGAQAAGIAALAARHGNGLIDLSTRANLQLRGVTEAAYPALIAGLRALGLLDETAEAEARRNIVVQPFRDAACGTEPLARALAARLAAADAPDLPGKFGFAVDTGAQRVLENISADIRIERHGGALFLRPDGLDRGLPVSAADAVDAALALARWFIAAGGIEAGRGRMAACIAHSGPPPGYDVALQAAPFLPQPGATRWGWLVGFAFGQLEAEQLDGLAQLGALRLTPWRMLLVEGAGAAPGVPGLITRADDPLLRVVACTGAPGCGQALQPTRDLARDLAHRLAPHGAGRLHVSGCAKGCAHPGAAPVTLCATPAGFALIRHGRAADPALSHHTAADLMARPDLLEPQDAPYL